ncbi:hypothetical protein [Candidatus Contubernalis alkaliaceticus]|uniref:hypothetical protein n=1 Tax=Candidatus Contubernalis alkaliaceticus TaxID=338645 RepID=UPI001F4C2C2C|nr:hypothetical protein [Candidatus Contubernalis alkalaceticus]UNC93545.1 hypothetical protein HUE98_16560 [Candidatus Contubernalis alkalaceticus]
MNRIFVDKYAKKHVKHNSDSNINDVKRVLKTVLDSKKKGASCNICGQPIWAIGSAFSGFNGCFTCIIEESDDSQDYELY